jgi:hypothetical protein
MNIGYWQLTLNRRVGTPKIPTCVDTHGIRLLLFRCLDNIGNLRNCIARNVNPTHAKENPLPWSSTNWKELWSVILPIPYSKTQSVLYIDHNRSPFLARQAVTTRIYHKHAIVDLLVTPLPQKGKWSQLVSFAKIICVEDQSFLMYWIMQI